MSAVYELIHPRVDIRTTVEELDAGIRTCEWGGRISHKSQTGDDAGAFVARWGVDANHASMLRYAHLSVELTAGRDTLNQLVRHHVGGVIIQESQRYVKYGTEKNPFTLILPPTRSERIFLELYGKQLMQKSVDTYAWAIEFGLRPEQARKYLLLDTASTMRVQFNLEAWRHILRERLCNSTAQLDIRLLLQPVYDFLAQWPWLVKGLEPCVKDNRKVEDGYVIVAHGDAETASPCDK